MTSGGATKQSGGSVVGFIILAVVILALIGHCSSNDTKSTSSSSSSTTTSSYTPSATAAPFGPTTPETPAGPVAPQGVTFHTEPGTSGDVVFAAFEISDNFTNGLIRSGAQFETIDILKYAKGAYPAAARVFVQGSFPMKDAFGNTSTDVILNVGYDRATLDKINFEGVDHGQIWDIRDVGMVNAELQG